MKNRPAIFVLLSALLLLSGCTVWREHPGSSKWTDATGGEGLERSFWKEVKDKRWNELEHHMAANYIAVSPGAGRFDKAAALAHLQQVQLDDYTLGDVETEMNSDTFVVTYTVAMRGTVGGQPLPSEPVRIMTVWQKQKAVRMAIAHSVLGPEKKITLASDPESPLPSFRVTNHRAMRSVDRQKLDGLITRRWRQQLLSWYDRNRRDLPWRQDRDPYRVWLSEIMLQQTRVSAVLEHYRRFLQRFPTVRKLASAREPAVLAAWSGLGYYRRARMMHAAAKAIVKQHGGKFPGGIAELRALPGIGRYTAAAIASIVFDVPAAVVDGNVERVLGRVFGPGLVGESFWQTAEALLSRKRPGDFNQAMMELGATVCLPRQPRCSTCPVFGLCATRGTLERPKKSIRQKQRDICYALDHRNGSVFLVQRPKHSSLMPGMWELPEIPGANGRSSVTFTLRHSITVTDYTVRVLCGPAPGPNQGRWVPRKSVPRLPLTGLTRKILRQAHVIQ